jgi:hypothetical protein
LTTNCRIKHDKTIVGGKKVHAVQDEYFPKIIFKALKKKNKLKK